MNPDAPSFTVPQLERMAKSAMSSLTDSGLQLAYLVGDHRWDEAAQLCLLHRRNIDTLAGCVGQLLPQAPSGDAPKEKTI